MARRVQDTGRTGWYYRVLEEGRVGPGDTLDLLDRPVMDWPLDRILHLLYLDTLNTDDLAQLAELSPLTASRGACSLATALNTTQSRIGRAA